MCKVLVPRRSGEQEHRLDNKYYVVLFMINSIAEGALLQAARNGTLTPTPVFHALAYLHALVSSSGIEFWNSPANTVISIGYRPMLGATRWKLSEVSTPECVKAKTLCECSYAVLVATHHGRTSGVTS